MESPFEGLSQKQRERLAFIEFRAYFLGEIRRTDISERFGVESAAATRDLTEYRRHGQSNLVLDPRTKSYVASQDFKPLFPHPIERVLSALSQGFGEGIGGQSRPLIQCEVPRSLNTPNIEILAPITQAIHRKKVVRIAYRSFSSGASEREIVPFALAHSGLRWHVRGYCRRRKEFRDFVLTRIEAAELIEQSAPEDHETPANDIQWSRILELELVPHPSAKDPELIALDYGMDPQAKVLRIHVRAALAGYFLRQWSVDCSEDHGINAPAVRLWLRNPFASLYGVKSANLAPGFSKEQSNADQ